MTVKRQKTEINRAVEIVKQSFEQKELEKKYAEERASVNQLKLFDPADYAPPKAAKQPATPLPQEDNDQDDVDDISPLKNNEIFFTLEDASRALKGMLPKPLFRWPGNKP